MSMASYTADSSNKVHGISHTYAKPQQYTMKLADIVTQLNMISTQTSTAIDKDAITKLTIGSNVSAIGPSCFVECDNLKSVIAYDKLKVIGRQAFYGCKSLTSFSSFCKPPIPKVHVVEQSAFAETGLVDISISLSGTATDTYISPYAFANCTSLKSVTTVGSNYLADFEFAGCTALTSVKMANSHSFSGEYTFKGCTSLKDVVIPANTFMVNNGLFYGCTSLTSVVFDEPSQLAFTNCIGNNMFSGTNLTSLTLPASITSYTHISPYAFANMPQLKEIHFNGIPFSSIVTVKSTTETMTYKKGFIYAVHPNDFSYDPKSIFKKQPNIYNKNDYIVQISDSESIKIIRECYTRKIPMLIMLTGDGCSHCRNFMSKIIAQPAFLDWIKSDECKCIVIEARWNAVNKKFAQFIVTSGVFPHVVVYSGARVKISGGTAINDKTETYTVMNSMVYGITDWSQFKNDIFSGEQNMVSLADAFKEYYSNGRTQLLDGEPKYGIRYLQDVENDPSLALANQIISKAKQHNVPLLMGFRGLSNENSWGTPYYYNLPAFFIVFNNVPTGANKAKQAQEFLQFLQTHFPGLNIYRDGYYINQSYVGWHNGQLFIQTEHQNDDVCPIPETGFAGTSSSSYYSYQWILHTIAPDYSRQLQFEQSTSNLKYLTEYEKYAMSQLSAVNLSSALDNVYQGLNNMILPDSTTNNNFKYGTWYGSTGIVGGGARKGMEQYKECHLSALHAFCDTYNIPLLIYSTNSRGGCGHCNASYSAFLSPTEFRNWFVKAPYMFFADLAWNGNSLAENYMKKSMKIDPGDGLSMCVYWKKKDGIVLRVDPTYDDSASGNYFNCEGSISWIKPYLSADSIHWQAFKHQLWEAIDWMLKDYQRDPQFENQWCQPYVSSWKTK